MREAGCTNFKLSLWDGIIQAGMLMNMTIKYFVEGLHHMVLTSSF